MDFFKPYPKVSSGLPYGTIEYKNYEYVINNSPIENNRAIHGDIVYLDNLQNLDNLQKKVVGIKERFTGYIVGIIHLNFNQKYGFTKRNIPYFKFTPLSGKFPTFIVPSKCKDKKALYCVIKINKWDTINKKPIGQIEYLLGAVGNMEAETEVLLYKNNIYPKRNKIEYNDLPSIPIQNWDYKTFSIDPKGCKDIDDALHFKVLDCGGIEVGIHIANVSRFIKKLDTNFFSSIYLKDKIITMLKENYSFDTCSLGSRVNKRSLSLIINYKEGEITNYEFKETIVRNVPLSYQDAEQMICNSQGSSLFGLWEHTCELLDNQELSATKMVEYYMLLYNRLVAETLYKENPNTILRTHKKVEMDEKNNELEKYLQRLQQNAASYQINPKDTEHQDLGLQFYTHATSPIRRFVDIINQKNIIKYLNRNSIEPNIIKEEPDNIIEESNIIIEEPNNIIEESNIIIEEPNIIKEEPNIIEESNNLQMEKINSFQKNLRKFYNNYKKLDIIFGTEQNQLAYIIEIKDLKVKLFIPELDIEHSFYAISSKLVECNLVEKKEDTLIINGTQIKKFDKVLVKITPLPYEEKFNKKLYISLLEPEIVILL